MKVLITGGCSGIGQATAEVFWKHGAEVTVIDNNIENIAKMRVIYNQAIRVIQADVGSYQEVEEAFYQYDQTVGKMDIFIANAGISIRNKFIDISPEQWRKIMRVNLDGVFYCSKLAAVRMLENKSGVILMTASTNGIKAHPYYSDYNASKAAIIALAKSMALELAPFIRVNAVAPGYVLTPMQLAEYTEEMLEKVNASLPLKRHATPTEIANLFYFLASSEAAYITGQVISIDGGETA